MAKPGRPKGSTKAVKEEPKAVKAPEPKKIVEKVPEPKKETMKIVFDSEPEISLSVEKVEISGDLNILKIGTPEEPTPTDEQVEEIVQALQEPKEAHEGDAVAYSTTPLRPTHILEITLNG